MFVLGDGTVERPRLHMPMEGQENMSSKTEQVFKNGAQVSSGHTNQKRYRKEPVAIIEKCSEKEKIETGR